jgi:hypothetical protein
LASDAGREDGVNDEAGPRQWLLCRLVEQQGPWLPLVGLAAWVLAGGWQESDFQARNWALLMSALYAATLIPVRSSPRPRPVPAFLVTWLGWLFLAGLVFFTR